MKKKSLFIFLFVAPLISYSQWNGNTSINTAVCVQQNDQLDARIVTDGRGGAIITWLDFRNDGTQTFGDIFSQRMDKNGIAKWTAGGVAICTDPSSQTSPTIVEDGNGGAIIAWNEWRNGDRDIYAQKIDSSGVVQWTANGVSVVAKTSQQQDPKIISDGAGGAIIVWQDSVNGAFDIYAQRLSSSGATMWAANGSAICTAVLAQVNPKIESDRVGGAIITWQDKRNGTDYDIYAQRVNQGGIVQWAANGVPVCSASGTQSNPKIEPDGAGGVYIGWQDKRNGNDYDIYANRLNSSGIVQWNTNGSAVSVESGNQSAVDMTSDGIDGVILTWKDDRNGPFDIYFQRADSNGVMRFSLGGNSMPLANFSQINPNIIGDGVGGAVIVWQDSTSAGWDIQSGRIDTGGAILWTSLVGTATDDQTNPKNVPDGNGGAIFTWQDMRNTNDLNIYAHHLNSDGTVNGIQEKNTYVETRCFPNPMSGSALIEISNPGYNISPGSCALNVFDVSGKIVHPYVRSTSKGFFISRQDLANGIYFYEIRSNNNVLSRGKLILNY